MGVLYFDLIDLFNKKIQVLKGEFYSKWKIQLYFKYIGFLDRGVILIHNCNNDKCIGICILGGYIRTRPTTSDIKEHLLFVINSVWR